MNAKVHNRRLKNARHMIFEPLLMMQSVIPWMTANASIWNAVYAAYGDLKDEVIKLNTPDTITDEIEPAVIEENWQKIREIARSVPNAGEIRAAMKKAGCAMTNEDIAVSDELRDLGLEYHPYMRRRLSLRRLANMID